MKAFNGTPVATIVNDSTGIPFTMRLVRKGDGYGRNHGIIHDKNDPLVEFYDARYKFEGERGAEYGQFVSRYYVDTLMRARNNGLNLDGGIPDWSLDAETFALFRTILFNWSQV